MNLTHYIVRSVGYLGYWGRGETIEAAIKAAIWIAPGEKVHLIRCDATARINDMGDLECEACERLGTGIVTRGKKGLKNVDPTGGMK